jgi:protein involved in polysaccharide export with SLBB domain
MNRGLRTVRGMNKPLYTVLLAVFILMLTLPSVWAQGSSNMVYLRGQVKNPGEYLISENPTLYRLLMNHSGLMDEDFRNEVYEARGEIVRTTEGDEGPEIISFSVMDVLNREPGSNIPLQVQDMVRIYKSEVTKAFENYVWITGFVKNPGRFDMTRNMTLADLLLHAGGFTADAYMLDAEVSRVELHGIPGDTLNRTFDVQMMHTYNVVQNPEEVLSLIYEGATPASNFKMEPYDQVHIRRSPDITLPNNVVIEGQVLYPGTYSLERRDETLSELIDRAGGLTSDAFVAGGQLLRAAEDLALDFTINELRSEVRESREEMELRERSVRTMIGGGMQPQATSSQGGGLPMFGGDSRMSDATAEILEMYEASIRRYQDAKESYEDAMGLRRGMKRINVDFDALLMRGDKKQDVVLLEGDKIVMPKAPGTVTVLGQVNNPGVFDHAPGETMEYYVLIAGGKKAGAGKMVVTQPTGYSYALDFLSNPKVMQGAVVRVLRAEPGSN